jgi:hypothetical protein
MASDSKAKPKKDRGKYLRQIRDNYRMTREVKPRIGWVMAAIFLAVLGLFMAVGFWLNNPITALLLGVPLALLATTIYFSRQAMSAAYSQVEDQPGGAAAVAGAMRGNWSVKPGVSVTKNQDLVHRVVGRPGIVLLSEGPASRVEHMLTSEAKRTARYVPDIPIQLIQVGTEDGQVPVSKLQKTLGKLPSVLTPAEVTAVRRRLDAVAGPPASLPKGPVPKSPKAARKGTGPR